EALEVLHNTQLDLLVSDLRLPDGNGMQVMRELSKISDAKGIAVSGYGMDEDLQRSREAGFSAHLTKPVNVQELTRAIREVTELVR
ncbi:MAG: response regulator, partial [Chthoniobacterales bacterium]